MPYLRASSQCGSAPSGSASGSDVILTTSFSSALLPAGTISVGTLGRVTMSAFMRSAASRSCSSSVFDSSFKSVTRPLAASASSRRPAAKSFPISLERAFCSARQPSSRCWLGREVSGLSPMMPMTRWPLAYNCSIITAAAARSSTLTLDRFSMPSPAALFVSSRQGMPSDASAGVKHCGCAPMKKRPQGRRSAKMVCAQASSSVLTLL